MLAKSITIPLHLGPLAASGYDVERSGIHWLCGDGHVCRPGEVVAYCHVGLAPRPGYAGGPLPFREESRDFQAALAPRWGGRLFRADVSRGGWLDEFASHHLWSPDTAIGRLEVDPDCLPPDAAPGQGLRTLLLAGRRLFDYLEVRAGLLSGCHDRLRAWWGEGDGGFGNVLSLGSCEQAGIIPGERRAFLELFETVPGPAHVTFIPGDFLVASAPVLCSQIRRTPAEQAALLADVAARLGPAVAAGGGTGALPGWAFAAALLKALCQPPPLEPSDVLTATGIRRLGPPGAVLLSLNSEEAYHFRHKRLGYVLGCHGFRLQEAGPLIRQWLRQDFEVVGRSPDDVKRDYLELIDLVRSRTNAPLLVLNLMSSSSLHDCLCYAPFERPLRKALPHIRAQELNLVLYELARERDVSVIDLDAVAADLGGGKHIPDRVHQSGPLQAALRTEVVRVLRERGIPGFGPRPVPPAPAVSPGSPGARAPGDGIDSPIRRTHEHT